MFYTPLFVTENHASNCQGQQPTPQQNQQDSANNNHRTLTHDTFVVTDPVVTAHGYSVIITDELNQSSLRLEIKDI